MGVTTNQKKERGILVGTYLANKSSRWEADEFLDELKLLSDTAGVETVHTVTQQLKSIDPGFFVGRGKVREIAESVEALKSDVVIFDDELSPRQAKNLSDAFKSKVVDRSALILDIFAKRAKTKEAKTQVELAQLQYLLPRLTRQWSHLSRQHGGVFTKGPGETQLETDRRLVRTRIGVLKKDLEKIEQQRRTRRKGREDVFRVALVGYTNVGKSTLLNALSDSDVFTEDRLFATLDSTVRKLHLDGSTTVLLSDTVGFIRKLPHHLVASFKSTLEEAVESDLLLHVVDLSHPFFEDQMRSVVSVLKELGASDKTILVVNNKVDRVESEGLMLAQKKKYPDSAFISARNGIGLNALKETIAAMVKNDFVETEWTFDQKDSKILNLIYSSTEVLERDYAGNQITVRVKSRKSTVSKITGLLNGGQSEP